MQNASELGGEYVSDDALYKKVDSHQEVLELDWRLAKVGAIRSTSDVRSGSLRNFVISDFLSFSVALWAL